MRGLFHVLTISRGLAELDHRGITSSVFTFSAAGRTWADSGVCAFVLKNLVRTVCELALETKNASAVINKALEKRRLGI